MPQISVIVTVYKAEAYLERCVDSILAQTYKDFELILVDDGSPDKCPFLCDEYAKKDERVKTIHQRNSGVSAARNTGLSMALNESDSEWIYFVDSDDWIHPMSLEALMKSAELTGLSVIIGGYECTNGENPSVSSKGFTPEVWDTDTYFCKHNINAVVPWGKIYKKECFRFIRYPVGKIHEDEFTTYKILFQFKKIAVIAEPLYAYFQNPNGITGAQWKPDRLITAEAYDERFQYFLIRKNQKMADWSLHTMFMTMRWQMEYLKKCDLSTRKLYEKKTMLFYKKKLKEYRKYLPFLQNEIIYETAYPRSMAIYYRVKRVHELGIKGIVVHVIKKWKLNL